jgi:uncharacterized protein YbaP (TraB family)
MKRTLAIADRAAALSLRLIVAANILFLLSFLFIAFLATGKARAEIPACTGEDMLTALRQDDPKLFQSIEEQAAATMNGKGLLWKIEKDGVKPSYLFGTMHMTDPRVTDLTPAARSAFEGAATVVIETTDILDQQKMMAAIFSQPDLMMFTDETTLMSLLSPQDASTVADALEARGIPAGSVSKMKPWMLSAMVALPACELARKNAGVPVLDIKLAKDAEAGGKKLAGLETVLEQLQAMASLPMEFHMKGLVETLKLGDKVDDVIETMIVLYEAEETGMFWPLFRAALPSGDGDDAGYADFEKTMITSRNGVMVTNAEPILAEGSAFIAVGALHLPGPDGVIELLRRDGYTVTPAG